MTTPPIGRKELAKMIDHSLLKSILTRQDTIEGLELALKYDVGAATVKPCYTALAADVLAGSDVAVNPVICFPLGYDTTETKVAETRQVIEQGAQEVDMVMNLGEFFSGEYDLVRDDIAAVVEAAQGAPVKVIFETGFFTPRNDGEELLRKACRLAEEAGVAFLKTSSGFAPSPVKRRGEVVGYTLEQLQIMRESVSDQIQVKAAQGVRSLDDALEVIEIGATRFGVSRTAKVMKEWQERFGA